MAKEKIEVGDEKIVAPKGDRQARWDKYVENYRVKNPVKYASKKANGEFDEIPVSFR